jgi:hypothetical protein
MTSHPFKRVGRSLCGHSLQQNKAVTLAYFHTLTILLLYRYFRITGSGGYGYPECSQEGDLAWFYYKPSGAAFLIADEDIRSVPRPWTRREKSGRCTRTTDEAIQSLRTSQVQEARRHPARVKPCLDAASSTDCPGRTEAQ